MNERILLIGGDSYIGELLRDNLGKHVEVMSTTRRANNVTKEKIYLDLNEAAQNWDLPNSQFQAVIMLAGLVGNSICEENPEGSRLINVIQTTRLFEYFSAKRSHIIFLSSASVFNGEKRNIQSSELPNPDTPYGQQKYEAEMNLRQITSNSTILRPAKIINQGYSRYKSWINALRLGQDLSVPKNLWHSPISGAFLSQVVLKSLRRQERGIIHVSSRDEISYYEAARYLAQRLDLDETLIHEEVHSNPRHESLDGTSLKTLGLDQPYCYDALNYFLGDA